MSDACCLGKKARVGVKVEDAGPAVEWPCGPVWPALMCTVSGVVEVARVAGCGIGRVALSDVDTVVGEGVIGIGSVIPLDMCKLSEIGQIIMGEAAVSEQFCNVCVLRFVLCCQLHSMKIEPPLDLLLVR